MTLYIYIYNLHIISFLKVLANLCFINPGFKHTWSQSTISSQVLTKCLGNASLYVFLSYCQKLIADSIFQIEIISDRWRLQNFPFLLTELYLSRNLSEQNFRPQCLHFIKNNQTHFCQLKDAFHFYPDIFSGVKTLALF